MTLSIPDFSDLSVLVVGDVMLDRYWSGQTSRISPEAPVPIVRVTGDDARLGGAANVALNLSLLGCRADLIGVVGQDPAGVQIGALLADKGIGNHLVQTSESPTITKLRVISRQQQLLRLDFEEPLAHPVTADLSGQYGDTLPAARVVVLSDYAKGALKASRELIRAARQRGLPVLVDPKGDDFERYRGATLLTPNLGEFQAIAGVCEDDETLVRKARELMESLDLQALLITLSERGMALVEREQEPLLIPTRAREVFDVTGAGDTVIATLAACVGAGMALPEAVKVANIAAGIVVGKLGTAGVSREELWAAIQEQHLELHPGVLDEAELLQRVDHCRRRGEKIVMTNGCFDLLHPGHITYLEYAASLGDRLIVAVNTDRSVQQLKGPSRPINPQADRLRMLAALRSVDWVVAFDEDTPARLIGQVLPDVLIKGGDYRPEDIAGYEAVTGAGGEVVVTGFETGYSSTRLIERIKSS